MRLLTLCGGWPRSGRSGNWLLAPTAGGDPGRLRDLLAQQTLGLGPCACWCWMRDRLLEMGFWPDIQWLMKAMPEARQMLSRHLAGRAGEPGLGLLQDPVRIEAEPLNSLVSDIESGSIWSTGAARCLR